MSESLKFSTPEQELEYLRLKVFEADKKLDNGDSSIERLRAIENAVKDLKTSSNNINHPEKEKEMGIHAKTISLGSEDSQVLEMMNIVERKGVVFALGVFEKVKNWKAEDDFHSLLLRRVAEGLPINEKGPLYQALHMRLYEIILTKESGDNERSIEELVRSMEQFYAGLLSIEGEKKDKVTHIVFEIANPNGEEETKIFVSIPDSRIELFSKHLHAIFPKARLEYREKDYNIFNESGFSIGAVATQSSSPAYSIKTFDSFGADPMNVILNGFSKIPKVGSGALLQIVFRPVGEKYTKKYSEALKKIEKGEKPKEALRDDGIILDMARTAGKIFFGKSNEEKKDEKPPQIDGSILDSIKKKLESPIVETNMRLAVSAPTEGEANDLMHNLTSTFKQLDSPGKQNIVWNNVKPSSWISLKDGEFYRSLILRLFYESEKLPLNLAELSTILHFQTDALATSSTLSQSKSKSAPPPVQISETGTILGINSFQGIEKKIYIAPEDRLRHFYVIGQTGTGKSTLLKNMIIDDIQKGEGVCFIDPHGNDVAEILSNVPKERVEDVIYFDPAYAERPMALNMLEYDPRYPEQKTFVVNELFSIFQKLYEAVPESMGPMFEQYFRNATLLVIEDPESGSTLLDVSRVMTDKEFRDLKISKCKNPVVVNFWKEVATKAGGEASLANMIPYITSKFDVFLANDIMRPIIAQEKSSFNFREIMDSKKIFLVNLSKGRLGDKNAHLIGLILVGKILMAALSRVDSLGKDLPPFYLYIDEFQNITTNSISTILSEARKYKLSLIIAHQFIAQLQEDIKNAVFGNVGTICSFRVGQDDAEYLEKQFLPNFVAKDLASINNFNAYVKMLVHGRPADPFDFRLMPPKTGDQDIVRLAKELSSLKYGKDRDEIEDEIMNKYKSK